jgi:hypothetical protein
VDDLVKDVNGRAVHLERALGDLDRTRHTCAEPARLR